MKTYQYFLNIFGDVENFCQLMLKIQAFFGEEYFVSILNL